MKKNDHQRRVCKNASAYLGPRYAQRLLAAFSVILDGEGLLMDHGASSGAINEVTDAFRDLREDGDIDF